MLEYIPLPQPAKNVQTRLVGHTLIDNENINNIVKTLEMDINEVLDENISYSILKNKTLPISKKYDIMDKIIKNMIRNHIHNMLILSGISLSESFVDNISNEIFESYSDIINKHKIVIIEKQDDELVNKIKCCIEDHTFDGGVTRSQIRRLIGRNHSRYIRIVDDILAKLVSTGTYMIINERFIVSINGEPIRSIHKRNRGRPPKKDDIYD